MKKFLLILAAIIVVFVVIASFRSDTFRVERSAVITLPPSIVYAHLNDFHHWQKFNPFTDPDPDVRLEYEGAASGEGAIYKWQGNSEVGAGIMRIAESVPNEHIEIDMHFLEPFENQATAHFLLRPVANGTEVTWAMEGDNNLLHKCMGMIFNMDKMIGEQFEKGLARMNNFTSTEQLAMNSNEDILITREFNAPREAVWNAWTTPDQMMQWWAPNGYTCPVANMDVREGGKYHAAMRSEKGGMHWSTGIYKEIVPLQKLVISDHFADEHGNIINGASAGMPGNWPDTLLITVTFEDAANGARMTMKHEGVPVEMRAMCAQGWNECFDKMAALVENDRSIAKH